MIIETLLDTAARYPDRVAARDPFRTLTYARLTVAARVFRHIVLQQTQQQNVGVMLPSSCGSLAALLGVLWSGRSAVPLNFLLQPRELAAICGDAGLDLVISTQHFRTVLEQLPVRALYVEELGLRWRFVRERLSRTPEPPKVSPADVATIVYTSGTTGLPKGVCLTHDNFEYDSLASIRHLRIEPNQGLLGVIPAFHVFGLTVLYFMPIYLQGSVDYLPRFLPQATYEAMTKPHIGVFMAVPSMFSAIARLKHIEAARLKHIALTVSGGEGLPRRVYNAFRERTGLTLHEGYGLTETSPVISVDLPWAHRVGTVGPPLEGVSIEVRDEEGQPLPPGEEGELNVRGRLIMKGYYNKPEDTAAVIDRNGWFRTGDIVRVDPDQYIRITGRAKDIIIVGGENVAPREVENVLEQHPAVAESAVVGRPDANRGEVVVGYVVLNEGESVTSTELREFCRERLGGYKVPREIYVRTSLPHGPTGKILKNELKAMAEPQPSM